MRARLKTLLTAARAWTASTARALFLEQIVLLLQLAENELVARPIEPSHNSIFFLHKLIAETIE
jgi:hypothetical protein